MKNIMVFVFRDSIERLARKNPLGVIYYQLFKLKSDDVLEHELEYFKSLYTGNDGYFGEAGRTEWFRIWHKSIRNSDYFYGCQQVEHKDLLSNDERKEYNFLYYKCKHENFDKVKEHDSYTRYLYLRRKIKREDIVVSINGKLNSILWNTAMLDTENNLYHIFIEVFEFDLNNLKQKEILSHAN